jgi:hypothetical protein
VAATALVRLLPMQLRWAIADIWYFRDQATVLVQAGLLDPTNLPVVGAEGARKVVDEKSVKSNKLIPEWKATK